MMKHAALALTAAVSAALAVATACGTDPLSPIALRGVGDDGGGGNDGNDGNDGSEGDVADDPPNTVHIGDPVGDCGYAPASFDVSEAAIGLLPCEGPQAVRFDDRYGMFVGVIACNGAHDEVRLFLSESADGPFLPAADWNGVGEDQCELVNPSITRSQIQPSMIAVQAPLDEGVPLWERGNFGEPFTRGTSSLSSDASTLSCGIDVITCVATRDFSPADLATPSEGVPCSIGGTTRLAVVIPELDMQFGASDTTGGDGLCIADVTFFDPAAEHTVWRTVDEQGHMSQTQALINGESGGCSDYHCGVVVRGDGSVDGDPCDVFAFCDPATGLAHGVDWTW